MPLVLLIDDDPLVVDVVDAILSKAGYTVGVLTDGRDALAVIEFKRPALVLLDCGLPSVPGIEVLRQIRSSGTSFGTPVLMLTARDRPSDRDIAMRAGATAYMPKPFDAQRLVRLVDRMIGTDQMRHASFGTAH